jgi:hypothetical protein
VYHLQPRSRSETVAVEGGAATGPNITHALVDQRTPLSPDLWMAVRRSGPLTSHHKGPLPQPRTPPVPGKAIKSRVKGPKLRPPYGQQSHPTS